MGNLNRPSTPPSKPIDADRIRQTHNRPDPRILERHERIISELDSGVPGNKGGRRDGR